MSKNSQPHKRLGVTDWKQCRATAKSTVRHFIVVVVNPSLHQPGPGLTVRGCAPLVWDGGRLELDDHLWTQTGKQCFKLTTAGNVTRLIAEKGFTLGLCMTIVSPDGNSSLRCHWLVDTAFLYSVWIGQKKKIITFTNLRKGSND